MIESISKQIKKSSCFCDLSCDVIPIVLSYFQNTDFSYLSKNFYRANYVVMKGEISKMGDFFKDKYLFFQRFISELNDGDMENKKEKREVFIKKIFEDIIEAFKTEFHKYYENVIIKKYSKNSFSSEKVKEITQMILDANSILLGMKIKYILSIYFLTMVIDAHRKGIIINANDVSNFNEFNELKTISNKYKYISEKEFLNQFNERGIRLQEFYQDENMQSKDVENKFLEDELFKNGFCKDCKALELYQDAEKVRTFLLEEKKWKFLISYFSLNLNNNFYVQKSYGNFGSLKNVSFLFSLPKELNIKECCNLQFLSLNFMKIKFISVLLPNLKNFSLRSSNNEDIPSDISECMPKLKFLILSYNKIETISEEKPFFKKLLGLKFLKLLDLKRNRIKEFPKHLLELILGNNNFNKLIITENPLSKKSIKLIKELKNKKSEITIEY